MPVEIYSWEEFVEISKRALECRVKRDKKKGIVKVKARTKRVLYTIKLKVDEGELEKKLAELGCPKIVDIDKGEVREKKQ